MTVTTYKCDVCGVQKGEANHWLFWLLTQGELTFTPWSSLAADTPSTGHLCGAQCAHKKLDEYLGSIR